MFETGSPPQQAVLPRTVWTVAALLLATGDALASRFGAVTVRGELSGYARAGSGHCYFSLKDASGSTPVLLRCALFRRAALLLDFTPADGQHVELRGRIGVYEARGELQLVVEALRRVGAGTLYEEFLRSKTRLQALGLFDAARKRPVPSQPRAVGIVTSLAAAALHDVLTAFQRRSPHVQLVIYPSAVQGADAPGALVAAIQQANARGEVQTLLLVRGGGALEDLWAFNDERVVQAVAASRIPVVCGVGHETDVTLADLAADLRAPTPTAAAELAAPARAELTAALQQRQSALQRALQRALDRQAQRMDTLVLRVGRPAALVAAQAQRLSPLERRLRHGALVRVDREAQVQRVLQARLQRAVAVQLHTVRARQAALQQRLDALDPRRVLHRGYAWVEAADGRPVLSAGSLRPGQPVRAVWADGSAAARVEAVALDGPPLQPPI